MMVNKTNKPVPGDTGNAEHVLSAEDKERYGRSLILNCIDDSGQIKLLKSKILIIGLGGLGSAAAFYLAAAGVGTLGLADSDVVDLSNLQRQIIHSTVDLGQQKTLSAQKKIQDLNPKTECRPFPQRVSADNIQALIADYDFVLDCTDNLLSKFLINDACVHKFKPFSHAGVSECLGQLITYTPGTCCLRCLLDEIAAEETQPAGILSPLPGVVGALQATEAIKYVLGKGDLLTNKMLSVDVFRMRFKTIALKRDPECPACGPHKTSS